MKRAILLFALISCVLPAYTQDARLVTLTHDIYPFLEKCRNLALIEHLPQTRPYSLGRIQMLLDQVGSGDNVPEIIAEKAAAFRNQFSQKPQVSTSVNNTYAGLRFPAFFGINTDALSLQDTAADLNQRVIIEFAYPDLFMQYDIHTTGRFLSWQNPPYRKFHEPYRSDYTAYSWNFLSGDEGFNHFEIHEPGEPEFMILGNLHNQFNYNSDLFDISFGRYVHDWGPSVYSNLNLSAAAKPYDTLSVKLPLLGKGTFAWTTNFMLDFAGFHTEQAKKMLSTKRIEYQFTDWFMFGIYETIVYAQRFEIAYVNPFSIYYLTEVQNGEFDNKLGGMDFTFYLPGTKLYTAVYFDDIDLGHLFEPFYQNNEWGMQLGAVNDGLHPNLRIAAEFSYMSHWMYTHGFSSYSEPSLNSYQHLDSHIGHVLNPNSLMLYAMSEYMLSAEKTIGFEGWITMDGRLDIDSVINLSDEMELYGVSSMEDLTYYPLDFGIDGTVIETNIDASLYYKRSLPVSGINLKAAVSYEYTWNSGKVEGQNKQNVYIELEASITEP